MRCRSTASSFVAFLTVVGSLAVVGCGGGCGKAPEPAPGTRAAEAAPSEPTYQGATVTTWLAALSDPAERRPAILALGEALREDERVAPALAAQLRVDDAAVRKSASRELSLGGDAVVPVLAKILADPDPASGAAAADTLLQIGEDALRKGLAAAAAGAGGAHAYARVAEVAPKVLRAELESGDARRQKAAVTALARAGADEQLVAALANDVTREPAADALHARGDVALEALMAGRDDPRLRPHVDAVVRRIEGERVLVELRALAKDPSDRGATVRLERLGADAIPVLVASLGDPDLRGAAAGGLTRLGRSAADALGKDFGSLAPATRDAAADTLVGMGVVAAVPTAALVAEPGAGRTALTAAFGRAGEGGVALLTALLASDHAEVRKFAGPLLATHGDLALIELAVLGGRKNPAGRRDALDVLVSMGAAAVPTLVNLLGSENPEVRNDARAACEELGTPAAPALVRAVVSGDARAAHAQRVLEKLGAAAVPALVAELATAGPAESDLVALLAELGRPAAQALADAVREGPESGRAAAATALGHLGADAKPFMPQLADASQRGDAELRAAAITSMARLGAPRADLQAALRDDSPAVRVAAAAGLLLQSPGDTAALRVLVAALEDADVALRVRAVRGLAGARGKEASKALRKASGDEEPAIRLAAVAGWEENPQDPAAVGALAVLYDDFDPLVRARARAVFDRISKVPHAEVMGFGGTSRGDRFERRDLRKYGGSKKTQDAVERGLRWLAEHQSPDGSWSTGEYTQYRIGVTGLAMLAFQGTGHTHTHGEHKEVVGRALRYLLEKQDGEGCIGPQTSKVFQYDHAIATQALADLYLVTLDAKLREPAQRAVDFIHKSQNPYLAWRYGIRDGDNDTSVTLWMALALRVGQAAELDVDATAFRGAIAWTDRMTEPEFGRVGYQNRGGGSQRFEGMHRRFPADRSEAMTAAGTLIRICAGQSADNEYIRKAADLLVKTPPRWDRDAGTIDFYYWALGTEALFHVGGNHWKRWNDALTDALLGSQCPSSRGGDAGSWDPEGAWSQVVGRPFSTALGVLCLESYYRRGPWLEDDRKRRR